MSLTNESKIGLNFLSNLKKSIKLAYLPSIRGLRKQKSSEYGR